MSETLKSYLWVGLGSAFGGVARFWVSGIVAERVGQRFPWGTIIINITGSMIIGILYALTSPEGRLNTSRVIATQLLMVGVCGGFTTFSSFSLQTLTLAREGQWLWAGGNVLISVVVCLTAVWLGFLLGQVLNG
ncbi:MAG TPA: fluoride efflux transporter CrcB [Candidatus Baltobacteraceae bacterium]|jgi:CrcB protein|nr:fluoride efflux transporter CrcB [Candidatus Baltobacteraceae bacterium]